LPAEILQVISPEGKFDQALEPELSESDLLKLYRTMLLTRTFDTKILGLQRQGRIGPFVTSFGEEAAAVGSALALQPEDWIYAAYREVGALFTRGAPLQVVVNQTFGNREDLLKGRGMPDSWGVRAVNWVAIKAPVGTQLPICVGIGLAARLRGENIVALAYFGDGTSSATDFHTGMNFAGVFKAPAVFVCRNNGWAISTPFHRQTAAESVAIKAVAYGFPGVRVDGNDVLAVYRVTKTAVERARVGDGPTLIEAVTYRMGGHSTADDPKRYRDDREVEEASRRDPLRRFRLYLEHKNLWNESRERQLVAELEREVSEAIGHAEQTGAPALGSLFDDVYAELPWHLREQRDALMHEQHRVGSDEAGTFP
jgi:2-oxoisovalerate dehydrogenase E1 component alpha subunit